MQDREGERGRGGAQHAQRSRGREKMTPPREDAQEFLLPVFCTMCAPTHMTFVD